MMELDNAVAPNVRARRLSLQFTIMPGFIVAVATAIGVAAVLSQADLSLIGHFAIGTRLLPVDIDEVVGNGVSALVGVSPDAAWPAIYAPLLIVAALLILRVIHDSPAVARTAGRIGLAALGLSLVVGVVWVLVRGQGYRGGDRHIVELVTEEGLELLGWCLIAGALAAVAWTRRSRRAPA